MIHGKAEAFWIFVKDVDSEVILYHEYFSFEIDPSSRHLVKILVPVFEPCLLITLSVLFRTIGSLRKCSCLFHSVIWFCRINTHHLLSSWIYNRFLSQLCVIDLTKLSTLTLSSSSIPQTFFALSWPSSEHIVKYLLKSTCICSRRR